MWSKQKEEKPKNNNNFFYGVAAAAATAAYLLYDAYTNKKPEPPYSMPEPSSSSTYSRRVYKSKNQPDKNFDLYEKATLNKIRRITTEVESIFKNFDDTNFNEKSYRNLEKYLNEENIALDNIDTRNNSIIRECRKIAVQHIQACMRVVEDSRQRKAQQSANCSESSSFEDQTMSKIKNIFQEIQALQKEVEDSNFKCDFKKYEELLFQKNLQLDNIDIQGNHRVREYRKIAIVYIQTVLKTLDHYSQEQHVEQPDAPVTNVESNEPINRANRKKDECAVCLGNLKTGNLFITECDHQFHYKCLKEWLESDDARSCPLCREFVEM